VPKGFKLPHDQQKYDGSQEPQSWLADYLQAVQILGGTKEAAMQSLQLHLTGAARSWLSKLEKESIGSWKDLTKQFFPWKRKYHSSLRFIMSMLHHTTSVYGVSAFCFQYS
jgi:hypothetical protein